MAHHFTCYGSIPLALRLIGRDGGLSTLCHSCGFACQQRVLKTFPDPGYLHSEDGVVWLWDPLVNLCIYIYIYIYIYISLNMTQSAQTTVPLIHHKALWLSRSKIIWWAIYIQIYQEMSVKLKWLYKDGKRFWVQFELMTW